MVVLIIIAVVLLFSLFVAARTIKVIPQARAGVVERLGRYHRTLDPGLTIVSPFIDRVRPLVDLREQVVNFKSRSVITEDNVVVGIETVLYFTVIEARSATYEIANPLQAIEQLTVTTLRNVIGGLTLEATLRRLSRSGLRGSSLRVRVRLRSATLCLAGFDGVKVGVVGSDSGTGYMLFWKCSTVRGWQGALTATRCFGEIR